VSLGTLGPLPEGELPERTGLSRGTEGSNPSPSTGESSANLTSSPSTAGYRQKQCGNLRLTLRLSQAPEGHTPLMRDQMEPRMRRHNFYADVEDDSLPVMVPRNKKAVVPTSPERVRRLRKHLVVALRALRTMKNSDHSISLLRPEPEGFVSRVARTACSLCKGWCCRNGKDNAFLNAVPHGGPRVRIHVPRGRSLLTRAIQIQCS
jgi:hypothetical protein